MCDEIGVHGDEVAKASSDGPGVVVVAVMLQNVLGVSQFPIGGLRPSRLLLRTWFRDESEGAHCHKHGYDSGTYSGQQQVISLPMGPVQPMWWQAVRFIPNVGAGGVSSVAR